MKKIYSIAIILLGAVSLGAIGNAHAYAIDGEAVGVDKYTVTGFGSGDALVVTANAHPTTGVSPVLTDVGTAVDSEVFDDTTGITANFIHDYVFVAIQDTFASVVVATENVGAIADLAVSVWLILDGGALVDINKGSADLAPSVGGTAAVLGVELMKDATYVIRMAGGALPANPNYTLSVTSAVPVPAAIWLFGTAIMGLIGFRRKFQAKGAVAV